MVSTSVDIPTDATYDETLQIVEEQLYNGARVTPEWMGLKKVAQIRDEEHDRDFITESQSTHGDVIKDLKERNPGVPPWAFIPQTEDKKQWIGIRPSWAKETEYNPMIEMNVVSWCIDQGKSLYRSRIQPDGTFLRTVWM